MKIFDTKEKNTSLDQLVSRMVEKLSLIHNFVDIVVQGSNDYFPIYWLNRFEDLSSENGISYNEVYSKFRERYHDASTPQNFSDFKRIVQEGEILSYLTSVYIDLEKETITPQTILNSQKMLDIAKKRISDYSIKIEFNETRAYKFINELLKYSPSEIDSPKFEKKEIKNPEVRSGLYNLLESMK